MPATVPADLPKAFAQALNQRDVEALISLYEPEATMVPPGAPAASATHGLSEIRALHAQILATSRELVVHEPQVLTMTDLALLIGSWRMNAIDDTGRPIELTGTYTDVGRRQPDGTWRYV